MEKESEGRKDKDYLTKKLKSFNKMIEYAEFKNLLQRIYFKVLW